LYGYCPRGTSLDQLLLILSTLFTFFYKTSYFNEEVNLTELAAGVSIPLTNFSLQNGTLAEFSSLDVAMLGYVM
jgi:hypothetical protein